MWWWTLRTHMHIHAHISNPSLQFVIKLEWILSYQSTEIEIYTKTGGTKGRCLYHLCVAEGPNFEIYTCDDVALQNIELQYLSNSNIELHHLDHLKYLNWLRCCKCYTDTSMHCALYVQLQNPTSSMHNNDAHWNLYIFVHIISRYKVKLKLNQYHIKTTRELYFTNSSSFNWIVMFTTTTITILIPNCLLFQIKYFAQIFTLMSRW